MRETKRALLEFLIDVKRKGKTVVGYGAPGKGNTLLNYCGIRRDFVDYTVDRSPHKQNNLLPGSRIPIYAPEKIFETKPDYILILPWNLRQEIMTQMADVRKWGAKFVVPIPRAKVSSKRRVSERGERRMKVVILAGGLGTRLSEETSIKPKPMVEVGGRPILWHILKSYSAFGVNEAIICGGYRADVIKDYFHSYFIRNSDVTFDMKNNSIEVHMPHREPWKVTVVDTGQDTMTGGRVRRVRDFIGKERFYLTYGDGVSNVDINALHRFHEKEKSLVTLTAVSPPGRFGAIMLSEGSHKIASSGKSRAGTAPG